MQNDNCPLCNQPLVYDHFMDSMKCLFCHYRHHISEPAQIYDEELMAYAEEDLVDYGDYVGKW